MAHKRGLLVAAVSMIILVLGCTLISVLSGPRTLTAGDTATYVLYLGDPGTGHGDQTGPLYVVSEVPNSWSLLSNYYQGTMGGVPVYGTGTVVSSVPCDLPPVRDGFKRFFVEIPEGPASCNSGDSGEMTVEFDVIDLPSGEFVLKFWFIAGAVKQVFDAGPPAFAEINRVPHEYRFVGSLGQPAGALNNNVAVAASNDGRSVVLGGWIVDLSVMNRDPLTGAMSHNHYIDDPNVDGVDDLVYSPNDQQVYGVGGQRLSCFQRDSITGELSVSQILVDNVGGVDGLGGARSVAISEDGTSVYVAAYDDDAVSLFDRDPWTGDLSFVEAYSKSSVGISALGEPVAVELSPDGKNVYVAGSDYSCFVVFERHPTDGTLSHSQTVSPASWFDYSCSFAVSPDGGNLYSSNRNHNSAYDSLSVIQRDPLNGLLSHLETHKEGIGPVTGLINPAGLAVSPDGRSVFVAAHTSLVSFLRDPVTGRLSFDNVDFNLEGGVNGMPVPYQIALSPDGADLFYGSMESIALFSARTFADGFESGDTSGWSATEP
jgi:DNA-binding beta-propeller fold protein YncE